MKFYYLLLVFVFTVKLEAQELRANPIIEEIFTADPSVLVYNDTLYLFTGHDEQNTTNKWFYMRDWYVFSTADMITYTNHGSLLSIDDFTWVNSNAFAGHAIEKEGKFYWYISATHKTIKVNEGFAIGVAVANHPTGPYKDALGSAIIADSTPNSVPLNIDPAVYTDADGQSYLFWGSWGQCRMVKLNDNMIETEGAVQTVNVKNFFEAPFIHKRGEIYYLTYAGSGYPSVTEYCTSSSINGPWVYRGVINDLLPISETNHQAVVEFKGNWYFVYHSSGLPTGGVYRRSVCVDKLEYDSNGLIKKVVRTVGESTSGIFNESFNINKKELLVYPNPSISGKISINVSNWQQPSSPIKLNIYNSIGQLIFSRLQDSQFKESYEIDLSQGIYLIVANSGNKILSERIVIN